MGSCVALSSSPIPSRARREDTQYRMQSRSASPSLRAMARILRMLASVVPCGRAGNAGSCRGWGKGWVYTTHHHSLLCTAQGE